MDYAELARLLVEAADGRDTLLAEHATLADVELARELKAIAYTSWSREPARSVHAAAALRALAGAVDNPEITAFADWCAGMAALVEGQMEQAVERFTAAADSFTALGRPHDAASTAVPKLMALAILGRYDEATEAGLGARDVFVALGDTLAAGKIEQNIGNAYWRRDRYFEAETFLRSARERFQNIGDEAELAKAENNLATVLTLRNQFRAAAPLYESALRRAELCDMQLTQAEVEANIGALALARGQYDRALDFFERSRRRYAALDLPQRSAVAEQELADAYLELNLVPEAAEIYRRVTPLLAQFEMRSEQARALVHYARAAIMQGSFAEAQACLDQARELYAVENNTVGAAAARLTNAYSLLLTSRYVAAAEAAHDAETAFAAAGAVGRVLSAQWVRSEALRGQGRLGEARELLVRTLDEAERDGLPQLTFRCRTTLGQIAAQLGDGDDAAQLFRQAVAEIEALRAPLPAEEFRTAFVADKLTAYAELVRVCLAEGSLQNVIEALQYVERSRSRALLDMLGGTLFRKPRDEFEVRLLERIRELREELNWLYSQINRSAEGDVARILAPVQGFTTIVRAREDQLSKLVLQFQQRGAGAAVSGVTSPVESLDIARLQGDLGLDTALVEYFTLDTELLAFIVTGDHIEVVRDIGNLAQIEAALSQFRFQVDALRHGNQRLRGHLEQLTLRAQKHLRTLYDQLLAAVEPHIGSRRLVIVPHRELYYVPFHALHDGDSYVVERRELCYAPSASILHWCLSRPRKPLDRALLIGVADDRIPRVHNEIGAVAQLFPQATSLVDGAATVAAVRHEAANADVVHLACHGQFRPDNPLYSSLRLADGWLTVRDAYELNLRCELVALSACETGLSAVSPGDEMIGLVRGFFSAGAPSLLASLWTVDDEATAGLMTSFYRQLRGGATPAAALRSAQRELLEQQSHPYFWSPFVLFGRW